jgi:hypothetical protein
MSRLSVLALSSLAVFLLFPAQVNAGSNTKPRLWQEGELISRKTVPADRHTPRNRYLYRVKGLDVRYRVVLDEPVNLDLHVPMRFSVGRKHLFIEDAAGQVSKATILERARYSSRR